MFKVNKNTYNFNIEDIFVVGKRANNPKRSFLFISKLLGKHLSVNPDVVKASGFLLSSLKYGFDNKTFIDTIKSNMKPNYNHHAVDDNTLVIGFCETATGLGMAVASSIEGCTYQTTTREPIEGINQILTFEEEHSHATTHKMFSDDINLSDYKEIILVDDEITTGNSLLNLIDAIHKVSNVKNYSVMTILDWRNPNQRKAFDDFCEKNNVSISVFSLIEGELLNEESTVIYMNEASEIVNKKCGDVNDLNALERKSVVSNGTNIRYFKNSGRFGVSYDNIQKTENECRFIADALKKSVMRKKVLVLGHGENIFIPSRVASYLKKYADDVKFRTTTLSPIYCDGTIIKNEVVFNDENSVYHLYNVDELDEYDEIILLLEKDNLNISFHEKMKILYI